ncbi:MAG: hypothetical protein ACYCVY_12075 [Acidiferrobacteraceae bacterium]
MADPTHTGKTLRDEALASVVPELHAKLLTTAADLGVTNNQDATWLMVRDILNANAAAAAAGAAAKAVESETMKIPEAIYRGTIQAGSELRAVVGAEVRERGVELGQGITAAIRAAADTGAAALKQAATDLPSIAAAQQDAIVQDWRAALSAAARDEARGALAGRMARSWGMVFLSLLLAAVLGAAGALGAARLTGHLTPWSDQLRIGPTGAPMCGVLRGQDGVVYGVCLTR